MAVYRHNSDYVYSNDTTRQLVRAEAQRLRDTVQQLKHTAEHRAEIDAGIYDRILSHNFSKESFSIDQVKAAFKSGSNALTDQELEMNPNQAGTLSQQKRQALKQYRKLERHVKEMNDKRAVFDACVRESYLEQSQARYQSLQQNGLSTNNEVLTKTEIDQLQAKTQHLKVFSQGKFDQYKTIKCRKNGDSIEFEAKKNPDPKEVQQALRQFANLGVKDVTISGGRAKDRANLAKNVLKEFIKGSGVKFRYSTPEYLNNYEKGGTRGQQAHAKRERKIDAYWQDVQASFPSEGLKYSQPGARMAYIFKHLQPQNKANFINEMINDPECKKEMGAMAQHFIEEGDIDSLMLLDAHCMNEAVLKDYPGSSAWQDLKDWYNGTDHKQAYMQNQRATGWGLALEQATRDSLAKVRTPKQLHKLFQNFYRAGTSSHYSPKSVVSKYPKFGAAKSEQYIGEFVRHATDRQVKMLAEQYAEQMSKDMNDPQSETAKEMGAFLAHANQAQRDAFIKSYSEKTAEMAREKQGITPGTMNQNQSWQQRAAEYEKSERRVAAGMGKLYDGVREYANANGVQSPLGVLASVDQACKQEFKAMHRANHADVNAVHAGQLGNLTPADEQAAQNRLASNQSVASFRRADQQMLQHTGQSIPAQTQPAVQRPGLRSVG